MNNLNNIYVESIVKKAIDGSITTRHAARKLGISRQYVNRLKKQYLAKGIKAFDHGNRGKGRVWKTDPGTRAKIIELYSGKYSGFNFRHYHEKLTEVEGIGISYKILHSILSGAGLKSPKSHRKSRKENLHPSRPRRQCFGELLQIDASLHNWFGEKCTSQEKVDTSGTPFSHAPYLFCTMAGSFGFQYRSLYWAGVR